jgi:hypothetical protein
MERFNGVNWSSCVSVYTATAWNAASVGKWNYALLAGGMVSGGTSTTSQIFNGFTLTAAGTATTRGQHCAVGCVGSALAAGGYTTAAVTTTQTFTPSTWTTVSGGTLNVARYLFGMSGLRNGALAFGGQTGASTYTGTTEKWDGSVWSMFNMLNVVKYAHGGCGSQIGALCAGGQTDGTTYINVTEKSVCLLSPNPWNYGITISGKNIAAI